MRGSGVDLQERFILRTRKLFRASGLEGEFAVGDLHHLAYRRNRRPDRAAARTKPGSGVGGPSSCDHDELGGLALLLHLGPHEGRYEAVAVHPPESHELSVRHTLGRAALMWDPLAQKAFRRDVWQKPPALSPGNLDPIGTHLPGG